MIAPCSLFIPGAVLMINDFPVLPFAKAVTDSFKTRLNAYRQNKGRDRCPVPLD